MRTISIRELHEKTGAWLRKSARLGEIRVTDHGRVVARILPGVEDKVKPSFAGWKALPECAAALNLEIKGRDAAKGISEDRNGKA